MGGFLVFIFSWFGRGCMLVPLAHCWMFVLFEFFWLVPLAHRWMFVLFEFFWLVRCTSPDVCFFLSFFARAVGTSLNVCFIWAFWGLVLRTSLKLVYMSFRLVLRTLLSSSSEFFGSHIERKRNKTRSVFLNYSLLFIIYSFIIIPFSCSFTNYKNCFPFFSGKAVFFIRISYWKILLLCL